MSATSRLEWSWLAGIALLASALGVLAFRVPQMTLVGAAASVVFGLGLSAAGSLDRLFLGSLGLSLIGYAFLGRTFAYLGSFPVFVGEVVLGLGLLATIAQARRWTGSPSPLALGIAVYMLWGAIRTVPYFGTYGLDALRDAAAWGYALFAFLAYRSVITEGIIGRIPQWYARLLPWLLVWVSVALFLLSPSVRRLPFSVKPGDLAVHLAGAGAFLLSGLYVNTVSKPGRLHLPERLLYLFWLLGCLFVLFFNRGGTLAILASVVVILLLRPIRAVRKIAWLGAVVLVATLASVVFDAKTEIRGREASVGAIPRILSTISLPGVSERRDTRKWRLDWWEKIWGYTVHGPYFWTGKGFGANLGTEDGFQVRDGSLRSPHNGALSVLARSGVPGLAIWLVVQLAFAVGMVRAYFRALRAGSEHAAQLHLWILAYWLAALVNSCFDVYLEGPQGAIWFWSIVGFGMATQRGWKTRTAMQRAPDARWQLGRGLRQARS